MITATRPRFEEGVDEISGITNVTVDGLDGKQLTFNAKIQGPSDFYGLRGEDYGSGFIFSTMPQLAPFIYSSLENRKDFSTANNVFEALRNYSISGNTVWFFTSEGMYVVDCPDVVKGKVSFKDRISLDEGNLQKLLSMQEGSVCFSDDRRIRFTPYGYKVGEQSASDLAKNAGAIATFGSEHGAELFAKASEHYGLCPLFRDLERVKPPVIFVPRVFSTVTKDRIGLFRGELSYTPRFSFGVSEKNRPK